MTGRTVQSRIAFGAGPGGVLRHGGLKPDEAQLQTGETEKLKLKPKRDAEELGGGKARIEVVATDARARRPR